MIALRDVVNPCGASLVVLGAGGAARAIAVAAALAGAEQITIVNRHAGRAGELAALVHDATPARSEVVAWDPAYRVPEGVSVVVNATSVGLYPEVDPALDIDLDSLASSSVVGSASGRL